MVRGSNDTIGGFNVFNADGTFQVMGGNLVSGNAGNGVVLAGAGNLGRRQLDRRQLHGEIGHWQRGRRRGDRWRVLEHDRRHVGRHAERDLRQPRSRRVDREHRRSRRRRRTAPRRARSSSLRPASTPGSASRTSRPISPRSTQHLGPVGTAFPSSGGVLVSHPSREPSTSSRRTPTARSQPRCPSCVRIHNTDGMAQWNGISTWRSRNRRVSRSTVPGRCSRSSRPFRTARDRRRHGAGTDVRSSSGMQPTRVTRRRSTTWTPWPRPRSSSSPLPDSGDGDVFDPISNTVYVAINGYGVVGYNLSTKTEGLDRERFPDSPTASRSATATSGASFSSTPIGGTIVEVPIGSPSTHIVIASGGTRGDLATVDPNNGTFLLTQSDRIVRLFPPLGASFKGGPTTTTSGNVIEGNLIGLGSDGTTLVANGDNGIMVSAGATGNTIGGSSRARGTRSRRTRTTASRSSTREPRPTPFWGIRSGPTFLEPSSRATSATECGSARASRRTESPTTPSPTTPGRCGPGQRPRSATPFKRTVSMAIKGLGINRGSGSNTGQSLPVLTAAFGSANASLCHRDRRGNQRLAPDDRLLRQYGQGPLRVRPGPVLPRLDDRQGGIELSDALASGGQSRRVDQRHRDVSLGGHLGVRRRRRRCPGPHIGDVSPAQPAPRPMARGSTSPRPSPARRPPPARSSSWWTA